MQCETEVQNSMLIQGSVNLSAVLRLRILIASVTSQKVPRIKLNYLDILDLKRHEFLSGFDGNIYQYQSNPTKLHCKNYNLSVLTISVIPTMVGIDNMRWILF